MATDKLINQTQGGQLINGLTAIASEIASINTNAVRPNSTSATENDIMVYGGNAYTAKDSGVSIETAQISGTLDTKLPTSKNIKTNVAGTAVLTNYPSTTPTSIQSVDETDTITQAIKKVEGNTQINNNNILLLDNIVQGVEYTYINGGYITLSGGVGSTISLTPIDNNDWAYIIIDNVTTGMVYSITGTGGYGPRLWAFVDEDLKILSVADNQETVTNKLIKAPANSKYLISDVSIASPHKLSTASLLDRLNASTF